MKKLFFFLIATFNCLLSNSFDENKIFNKAVKLIEKEKVLNLKKLISNYPKLLLKSNSKRQTLLHFAIQKNKSNIVKLLLLEGFVNIYKKDINKLSPLDYEIYKLANSKSKKINTKILNSLIKDGANLNYLNKDGVAPIHLAVIFKNIKLLKVLLKYGASINCADKDGWTPLHWAVLLGFSDIIVFLAKNNANIYIKNNHSQMPYDIVKYSEHCDNCFKVYSLIRPRRCFML